MYPGKLKSGFNVKKWIELCDKIDATDNNPLYRDEQRAWYDTLRDFLPSMHSLLPTKRVYSKELRWCGLNPENEKDIKLFKSILEDKEDDWSIEIRKDSDAKLARIVISGEWKGELSTSRKLLNEVCRNWPSDERVYCLITCGAFLNFDWPKNLKNVKDNKNPDLKSLYELYSEAEKHCKLLINEEIRKKLFEHTDFITIGIDSYKDKISMSNVTIRQPHIELVALVDLNSNKYYWTGKSYPTTGQEDGLIRTPDLSTHFINLPFGKIMVLGCHDLNIFSPRGKAVTKFGWRKKVRKDFYDIAVKEKPSYVLHHPHTTDSSMIWAAAWSELNKALPSVSRYISAGRYFRSGGERSNIFKVLNRTKKGHSIDFIVKA